MSTALDVAGLVLLVVVILALALAYRGLTLRLQESTATRERQREALTAAHDTTRAAEAAATRARTEVELLRSEWPLHVEARFPDDAPPHIILNGLPCERGLRGCDLEAVREREPDVTVLYLRLPDAPPAPGGS